MISVIIPFSHTEEYLTRLELVIQSLQDQTIPLEIIISETGHKKTNLSSFNIKHLFTHQINEFNLGFARNIGAKYASGDKLYFTDADIFFHDKEYFSKIKKLNLAIRPQMRRMNISDVNILANEYSRTRKIPYEQIILHQKYSSRIESTNIFVFTKNNTNEIFTASQSDLSTYKALGKPFGEEPRFWMLPYHASGVLISKQEFENVGGYCQKFTGWGCEDDDFLSKITTTENIYQEVTHLDHERAFFDSSIWNQNKNTLIKRLATSRDKKIFGDKKDYESITF